MNKEDYKGTEQFLDLPIDWVEPNPYNPNRQSESEFELLCRSMEEDGFTTPVIVDSNTFMIVDGEHRWRAWKVLGNETIPAHIKPYTGVEMRVSTLRHNRARGTEDITLTGRMIADLKEAGAEDWAKDSLMIDDVEWGLLASPLWADAPPVVEEQPETFREVEQVRTIERRETVEQQRADLKTWDSAFYQLNLTYLADEADLVSRVLGERTAESVLKLCTMVAGGEMEVDFG